MPYKGPLWARKAQEEAYEAQIKEAFQKGKDAEIHFSDCFEETAFRNLRKQSRKLTDSTEAWNVLSRLLVHQEIWVNPLEEWKPRGKAVDSLLRSLIRHLICKYRMPPFWYEVWFRGHRAGPVRTEDAFIDQVGHAHSCALFVQLAQGTGLHTLVKSSQFPVPLTKKQCHAVSQQRNVDSVTHAVRWTQVQSFGGDRSLAEALCATGWGEDFGSRVQEIFRAQVIQWFSAQGMLDRAQVGPLLDYINHCRIDHRDEPWSITGRTVTSLMRGMEEWHAELVQVRQTGALRNRKPPPKKFERSGFDNWSEERKRKNPRPGKLSYELHHIDELLTYDDLLKEGKELHHCITSYAWSIGRGSTSIWSYSMNDDKVLTIELHNPTKTIQQIRGLRNRMPTNAEMLYVQRWANEAGLVIAKRAVRRGW